MIELTSKRIMVTGGRGFLGLCVVKALWERGCTDVFVPRSRDCDLTTQAGVDAAFTCCPQIVVHLAAVVGGIGANAEWPGTFFYKNALMGLLMMEKARLAGVEKFVGIGTICEYPRVTPVPFRENDLWNGYPEETNAPYGLAKKMLLVHGQAYRQQYGFNAIHLLPTNLYGPGDNFDPRTSHVIPALIRKCVEAVASKRDRVVCWGTGNATREFLYVKDAAEGIVRATESYDRSEPVNLGSGVEIAIKELAQKVAWYAGFAGELIFDHASPDGQPRRCVDSTNARDAFGFVAPTSLDEGLQRTVAHYIENRRAKAEVS